MEDLVVSRTADLVKILSGKGKRESGVFGYQDSKGSTGKLRFFVPYLLFQVNPRVPHNGVVFPGLSGIFVLSLNYVSLESLMKAVDFYCYHYLVRL